MSRVVGFLAVLLLSLGAMRVASAQSGTIVGHVLDEDGMPLPGANVIVQGTDIGAAAGTDGSYRITGVPIGAQQIVASVVGFDREIRVVQIEPASEVRVDFQLREVAIESGEVVVTASRREQLESVAPVSISLLTPRDIESRNAVALDDALRYVPGVQMAGNQVNIRGSSGFSYNTGSRILLLLDGMPMLRPDVGGIPFDAIPMSQVEQIEVLKGPGSALYGGGALGGVINVITRDYPDAPTTSLGGYVGAYDPVRYEIWRDEWSGAEEFRARTGLTLSHARPLGGRTGIWAHFSYRYDAGHLRLSESQSAQFFTKFTGRFGQSGRLAILAGANRRSSDNFLFWNGARDALNPGQVDLGRPDASSGSEDNLINDFSLLPSYSQLLRPDLLATARVRLFAVLIQPLDEEGNPRPLSRGTWGFRYGGELQVEYSPSTGRHVTVGLTGDANASRSSFFDTDDPLSQPEGAVFVQWEESLRPVTLTAGARFDVYRVRAGLVERKLSPKLSASYEATNRLIFRAAFGEGFRVPSVIERFVSTTDYLPITANLDLRPESSRSYELGVRAFPRVAPLSMRFDVAAFWSDYWRLVEPTFVVEQRAFQFVNLTRARVRGMEVTLETGLPADRARLSAGYTLLDARDLTVDRPLVFRSEHLLKVSGDVQLYGIELGADFRLASKPGRVDSDFARFVKDAQMMVPIRVLDLRIGTSWQGVRASLHVKNALDYYYVERPALLAPPRHFILQLSTEF